MYLNPYKDISATLIHLSSATLILNSSDMLLNYNMKTIEETRLSRLLMLIEEYGSVAALARKLKVDDAQVNQWKKQYGDSKTGKPRAIGSISARKIEEKTGKPRGWMDQPVYESSDQEINATIELIKKLPPDQLHKVEEIVNLVCQPETKYGNDKNGNGK